MVYAYLAKKGLDPHEVELKHVLDPNEMELNQQKPYIVKNMDKSLDLHSRSLKKKTYH